MSDTPTTLYRVESHMSISMDGLSTSANIDVHEFTIIKETDKGYWIQDWFKGFDPNKRWVAKAGNKIFARLSLRDAYEDFIHRKNRHNRILKTTIRNNDTYVQMVRKRINDIDISQFKEQQTMTEQSTKGGFEATPVSKEFNDALSAISNGGKARRKSWGETKHIYQKPVENPEDGKMEITDEDGEKFTRTVTHKVMLKYADDTEEVYQHVSGDMEATDWEVI